MFVQQDQRLKSHLFITNVLHGLLRLLHVRLLPTRFLLFVTLTFNFLLSAKGKHLFTAFYALLQVAAVTLEPVLHI